MSEKKWSTQISDDTGEPTFNAFSPDTRQEMTAVRFDFDERHPPTVRGKICLFVESNDNRAQIWLTREEFNDILAGLQIVAGK